MKIYYIFKKDVYYEGSLTGKEINGKLELKSKDGVFFYAYMLELKELK